MRLDKYSTLKDGKFHVICNNKKKKKKSHKYILIYYIILDEIHFEVKYV